MEDHAIDGGAPALYVTRAEDGAELAVALLQAERDLVVLRYVEQKDGAVDLETVLSVKVEYWVRGQLELGLRCIVAGLELPAMDEAMVELAALLGSIEERALARRLGR